MKNEMAGIWQDYCEKPEYQAFEGRRGVAFILKYSATICCFLEKFGKNLQVLQRGAGPLKRASDPLQHSQHPTNFPALSHWSPFFTTKGRVPKKNGGGSLFWLHRTRRNQY